ncbi:hypothetical protein LSH36_66g06002 [Paralvinella palmiformis]|uniref:Polypeptide N-acetylgalactosaminyltransferase n=1 Tax=Paralvinella palmiformis TaxID=53620 RepID=A0AAD9NEJ5_9ANNE|nr:hypothetical protein LSH36_66g06002 [Paralvinella palmiformis]
MFSLSARIRYHKFRFKVTCAKFKGFLLLLVAILGLVWLWKSVDQSKLPDVEVTRMRLERYRSYQDSELTREGPGEHGIGVSLDPEELAKYKDINEKEGFNFAASEKVALDRSLPDRRSSECKARKYPEDLPNASVIIVYYNEAFSVIMRTAHSVINRTPPKYLKEVILLDDSSTRSELLEPLQDYIQKTWPDDIVRVVRTPERYGLIKAKLYGAEAAIGDVLVFLDAHCEAGKGWLEPILADIKEDPTRVICPIIGSISGYTLAYNVGTSVARGGFWWSMHFSWESLPKRDKALQKSPAHSYRSPTMAGGLFAADKEFFFRIGAYDPEMEIWGGENLDLSFRTWMCHGSLLFHPCSLVGHIFRATHPYGFPDKTRDYHGINSKRVAEVWMDDFKRYYYLYRQDLMTKDVGDLTERHAIRKREKCHSFEWYLDNVYPEKFKLDVGVVAFGGVKNPLRNYCFDVLNKEEKTNYPLGIYPCHPPMTAMNQIFSLTPAGQIRREGTCLAYMYPSGGNSVHMDTACDASNPAQLWIYKKDTGEIKHSKTGLCLDCLGLKPEGYVLARKCDQSDTQKWEWTNYYGKS